MRIFISTLIPNVLSNLKLKIKRTKKTEKWFLKQYSKSSLCLINIYQSKTKKKLYLTLIKTNKKRNNIIFSLIR